MDSNTNAGAEPVGIGASVQINTSFRRDIFQRLHKIASSKGITEPALIRLFVAMGIEQVEGSVISKETVS